MLTNYLEDSDSIFSTICVTPEEENEIFSPQKIDNVLEDMFFKEYFNKEIIQEPENECQNKSLFLPVLQNLDYETSTASSKPSKADKVEKKAYRKSNKKKFKCNYDGCQSEYKSIENLHLHILNFHKGIKPYKCSFCEARFSHRNGKIYHERKTHTFEFPYICNIKGCELKFPSKSSMTAHIKSAHLHMKRSKRQKIQTMD